MTDTTTVHPITRTDVAGSLPETLLKAYSEVCAVIDKLRDGRDLLHRTTVTRLHHTTEKLAEVTNATEQAATGILDGLDRSLALVDQLESLDASGGADALAARGQLRDELYQTQAFLQFQDITAQQLNYASSILVEMEDRLGDLARLLDPATPEPASASRQSNAVSQAFDPGATVHGADVRQALADAIFTART